MSTKQKQEYDFVIVGAGSAGCVLANRLSEDPQVSVLLLEAGGRDSNPWIHLPVGYMKTMVNPALNWLFDTEPQPHAGNRVIPVPRGKVLGGSSSINGMVYVRGQARDYDGWAQAGNRGWSYDDVLPYFKKSEHRENNTSNYHGSAGPLNVTDVADHSQTLDAVIRGAEECGFPRNPDYNGASQEGFGYFQVTQRHGRRWSTARAFLEPARERPNLRVITQAQATRIEFSGRRAAAIDARISGVRHSFHAGAGIILSAGAIQSPQLLELSGIGRPDILERHGVKLIHELPGVGENFQDHYIVRMVWRIRQPITLNERLRGLGLLKEAAAYAIGHRGALTLPAGVVYGFVKSRLELETPDVQYHIVDASFLDPKKRKLDPYPGLTIAPCGLRPHSRGSVHIKTADAFAAPAIQPNFLAEQADRDTLVAGLRVARNLAASPTLGSCIHSEIRPGPDCAEAEQLLDYARQTGATLYHPVGSCKMGRDSMAVVDDQLRVHGLVGLWVIDASIMPNLTSGNTNAPTIMIAEKGADMIKAARH